MSASSASTAGSLAAPRVGDVLQVTAVERLPDSSPNWFLHLLWPRWGERAPQALILCVEICAVRLVVQQGGAVAVAADAVAAVAGAADTGAAAEAHP